MYKFAHMADIHIGAHSTEFLKELEIKFIATLENGETIDLTKLLGISRFGQNLDQIVKLNMNDAYWEFSERCCEIFGKDGNLPLSEIDEQAELT